MTIEEKKTAIMADVEAGFKMLEMRTPLISLLNDCLALKRLGSKIEFSFMNSDLYAAEEIEMRVKSAISSLEAVQ